MRVGWAAAALAWLAPAALAAGDPLVPVGAAQLCVTDGVVSVGPGGVLGVMTPAMRAVAPTATRQDVEARFAYLGPTAETAALGSGEVRNQFGLKLRAADACNLVYAMWRFAPTPGVVVQVKSNPGAHDSATCGNNGYRDVTPSVSHPAPAPTIGRTYRLRVEMEATTLKVTLDGTLVWEGHVDTSALPAGGAVGMRSDNARLTLTLFAPLGAAPPTGAPAIHCSPGGED